jgi:hypothetical protein
MRKWLYIIPEIGFRRQTWTDGEGNYAICSLPIGSPTRFSAEPKGFKLAEVANIDLTLASGDLTRTVTLTGSYGLIPKTLIVGKVQV